jgi:cell division protein FtsZ
MRNGGVAILGSASVEGENRAQQAIEEALNSPLLNDNDIRGAKWILININSADGDHEFTMDEVEIIQNHLLSQTGENTDIILGLGYDNTLGAKIGITLIATGFEYKDPFVKRPSVPAQKKEEKIVMTLGTPETVAERESQPLQVAEMPQKEKHESVAVSLPRELEPRLVETDESNAGNMVVFTSEHTSNITVDNQVEKNPAEERTEWILSQEPETIKDKATDFQSIQNNSPASAVSGGYLARPSNIYAEEPRKNPSFTGQSPVNEPVSKPAAPNKVKEEETNPDMQLVFRDSIPAADVPGAHQTQQLNMANDQAEEPALQDEAEELKRRAAERINKLRNLSFNINAADPNNEFETVPAYIRRNLDLNNGNTNVENFYSSYEVKSDGNNRSEISTINTFLDGKKPD